MERVYLNFFSIGAAIPFVFTLLTALFLLTIKEKSRATLHLGIGFLLMACFNTGYILAAAWYDQGAAFHRWITVGFIMISLAHFAQFFMHFPRVDYPRFTRGLLLGQYGLAAAVSILFFARTWDAPRVFHFAGHYWDFAADNLSKIIGLIIFAYIFVIFLTGMWRMFTLKGKENSTARWSVLAINLSLMVVFVVPGITNILSRDGAMDRGTFQTLYDLLNILGFFFLTIVYINSKTDASTFMGKIIGITLVTFLLVLQFFSFYFIQVKEQAYDEVHGKDITLLLRGAKPGPETAYIKRMIPGEGNAPIIAVYGDAASRPDHSPRDEFANTLFMHRLGALPAPITPANLRKLTATMPREFAGYKKLLETKFAPPGADASPVPLEKINSYLKSLRRPLLYNANKIRALPASSRKVFDAALTDYIKSADKRIRPLLKIAHGEAKREAGRDIVGETGRTASVAVQYRARVLRYLAPLRPEGTRIYRTNRGGPVHYIAYMRVQGNAVYEVGYDYVGYRRYLHPAGMRVAWLLLFVLLLMLLGFRYFFKGALVDPLESLLDGVRKVNAGRLDVVVPIKVEDEIGFLSRSFNGMVESIRDHLESKSRMADSFSRFVPRQFLTFLDRENIVDIDLGDAVRKDMTVLFTDIRSFTAISEKMDSAETFQFLNAYLKRMNPAIHENGGFIDKFIGDAIMALFADAPVSAVRAAVAMQEAVNEYNVRRRAEGYDPIATGIGLHSGALMLGTVGSDKRLDTTVIGDTVNLAARIESMTKHFGARIVVSDSVYRALPDDNEFHMREIDSVKVKGKSRPVVLYEVFDNDPPELLRRKEAGVADFTRALFLYKAGDFAQARELFSRVRDNCPEDTIAALYIDRCEKLIADPPPRWSGVVEMNEK